MQDIHLMMFWLRHSQIVLTFLNMHFLTVKFYDSDSVELLINYKLDNNVDNFLRNHRELIVLSTWFV